MHIIQRKLLQLISEKNIGGLKLREIGALVGEKHPQKIKHHLDQLMKKGLIIHNKRKKLIKRLDVNKKNGHLINVPILGSANCGEALVFSDENLEGFLKVSAKLIKSRGKLLALKAVGNSMNKAKIKGKSIEDGDYIIINSEDKNPVNGDYIVSVIDDVCNVKKFVWDKENKQIILLSESNQDIPPIYIHPQEKKYFISGKVIDIIKKPRISWSN